MKKIMLFFAVACILAACNNDNEVLNEPQYITEFKAVFGGADTRMTATADNGLKFAWENGDALYVFQADAPTVYYKKYVYNSDTKKFTLATGGYTPMEEGKKYFAANDFETAASPFFNKVGDEIQFKANLNTANDVTKIPLISDVFTADAAGTIAAMHHTVGVVEVPVLLDDRSTFTTLNELGFYIGAGKASGDFIATPASPYFKEATNADANNTWANMGDKVLSTTEATSIFIPVLPGTYTDPGLNYDCEGGSRQLSLTGTLTVECGKVTKMPVQTLWLRD